MIQKDIFKKGISCLRKYALVKHVKLSFLKFLEYYLIECFLCNLYLRNDLWNAGVGGTLDASEELNPRQFIAQFLL